MENVPLRVSLFVKLVKFFVERDDGLFSRVDAAKDELMNVARNYLNIFGPEFSLRNEIKR